jgi:hypothetical protein
MLPSVQELARLAGYHIGAEQSVLQAVHRPEVSVAVWRRSLSPFRERSLAAWAHQQEPHFDEVLDTTSFGAAQLTVGLQEAETARWLGADLQRLFSCFVDISASRQVRVSLRAVQTDACRKFHVDVVRLRMITTYVGRGTEWLPNDAVRREALAHPLDCPCDANREIAPDRRRVRQARTGDVLLLRGEKDGAGRGGVHRSPPIAASQGLRLVLALSCG